MVRLRPGLISDQSLVVSDQWIERTSLLLAAGPDTPIGRATRFKTECLQVQLLLWVLNAMNDWLGRQPDDHSGLEPEMLWVQIPPEPLLRVVAWVSDPSGISN